MLILESRFNMYIGRLASFPTVFVLPWTFTQHFSVFLLFLFPSRRVSGFSYKFFFYFRLNGMSNEQVCVFLLQYKHRFSANCVG